MPNTTRYSEEGAGMGGGAADPPMFRKKESTVPPEPQVYVYVPGVRPRPVIVWLFHFAVPERDDSKRIRWAHAGLGRRCCQ
jgi:hypothetical protein